MTTRRADLALVVAFLLVISLPLAVNIAGRDGADPAAENRELATMPGLDASLRSFASYPNAFGAWFEDHFGFRATLVRWYGQSRFFWLDTSPSTTVIKGPNAWLFYADDGAMEDYTSERLFSVEQIEAWRETIGRTRSWLQARGIAYVFAIAPDKHAVYPEELPTSIHRMNNRSRTDQLYAAVTNYAGMPALDVRPALLLAKSSERIYFQTDTHWNDRGAFVAYRQIIEATRRQAPSVPPASTRADFDPTARTVEGLDLARMMGLARALGETDFGLQPKRTRHARVVEPPGAAASAEEGRLVTEIPGSSLPRAVIFRDSFASRLAPFLSEHFSRAVYLWQNDFDADVVLKEHANVVIQEIAGRHLYTFVPSPELIPQ